MRISASRQLPLLLLLLLLPAARACDPATPAASCSYGGLCGASGDCACRPEWTGANCSNLNLGPARFDGVAFAGPRANVSSWGGSVACVFATNACWMAVAVMAANCGLNSWESNSEIVLAQSPAVDGHYEPVQTLLAPFSHNPTMHVLPNRSIVIAHIGQGEPYHPLNTNCTNGSTPDDSLVHRGGNGGGVELVLGVPGALLPPPNFLFLESGVPGDGSEWKVLNSSGGAWAENNPALAIDANDGSAVLVYKVGCACPPPCVFCRQFGVATAPSWQGPYTDRGLIPVYGEDAYIWRDPDGVPGAGWHILFQGGSYAPMYPTYAGHWHTAFSPDGVSEWQVERFSMAFNGTIALEAGGSLELSRRERHQVVVVSATGAPAFLFNGAMLAGEPRDHTFTVVQPISH